MNLPPCPSFAAPHQISLPTGKPQSYRFVPVFVGHPSKQLFKRGVFGAFLHAKPLSGGQQLDLGTLSEFRLFCQSLRNSDGQAVPPLYDTYLNPSFSASCPSSSRHFPPSTQRRPCSAHTLACICHATYIQGVRVTCGKSLEGIQEEVFLEYNEEKCGFFYVLTASTALVKLIKRGDKHDFLKKIK